MLSLRGFFTRDSLITHLREWFFNFYYGLYHIESFPFNPSMDILSWAFTWSATCLINLSLNPIVEVSHELSSRVMCVLVISSPWGTYKKMGTTIIFFHFYTKVNCNFTQVLGRLMVFLDSFPDFASLRDSFELTYKSFPLERPFQITLLETLLLDPEILLDSFTRETFSKILFLLD